MIAYIASKRHFRDYWLSIDDSSVVNILKMAKIPVYIEHRIITASLATTNKSRWNLDGQSIGSSTTLDRNYTTLFLSYACVASKRYKYCSSKQTPESIILIHFYWRYNSPYTFFCNIYTCRCICVLIKPCVIKCFLHNRIVKWRSVTA